MGITLAAILLFVVIRSFDALIPFLELARLTGDLAEFSQYTKHKGLTSE